MLLFIVLADAFTTIVLARRTQRTLRMTRYFYRLTWWAYATPGRRIRDGESREDYLSIYGPLSFLVLLGTWAVGAIAAFGLFQWSFGLVLDDAPASLADALFFSGTVLFTVGSNPAMNGGGRALMIVEAGLGFSSIALSVAYLPILYQSYSTRELRIALLDARAGSPPSAGELLARLGGNPGEIETQLAKWEEWTAEVMQHHLSYPMLAYFRSHHSNQSWVSALTAMMDTAAVVMIASRGDLQRQAQLTFAMGRHALADLARLFAGDPEPFPPERLPAADFERLRLRIESSQTPLSPELVTQGELAKWRKCYEPHAQALSIHFLMALPQWLPGEPPYDNWIMHGA